ncbi:MAG: sulfatase-like hydrolase/transferase [Verrucomicrobiota bacterium]
MNDPFDPAPNQKLLTTTAARTGQSIALGWQRLLTSRFGGVAIFYLVFLTIALLTRVALLGQGFHLIDIQPIKLVTVFLTGSLYDLATVSYASIPLILVAVLLPQHWFATRWFRGLTIAGFVALLYLLLFGAVAEWFFWDEFTSRFNFIAVDYLIYTTEVIGNIRESYPMPLIFGLLTLSVAGIFYLLWKMNFLQRWFAATESWTTGRRPGALWLLVPLAFHFSLSNQCVPEFGNVYNQELARNGLYSFFAAFWDNSLNYERFYPTLPTADAFRLAKASLGAATTLGSTTNNCDITRTISDPLPEKHWNVIQITVESLSAKFLGRFGDTNGLTPHLDKIFDESLVFTNLYATGTRTVRGMEALTLCVPPTPGQSIVRRPHNDNLFSVGSLFRSRGYDTAFIYSGYGYFDNMNAFFAANGYRVVDRTSVAKSDITYATVWGACDEDLFRWTLREADAAFAAGKPFHHFVMTTSNHRPFGFPAAKVALPTGHREGAVQYTDYALGKFLETAQTKPWFTNTLFIIVGDHCASAAGKTALPIPGYHIPAIVWNPKLIAPQQVGILCSQIDLLPTVFGLMDWSYDSRFYGKDVLRMAPDEQRAFISTYQRLGYVRPGKLAGPRTRAPQTDVYFQQT